MLIRKKRRQHGWKEKRRSILPLSPSDPLSFPRHRLPLLLTWKVLDERLSSQAEHPREREGEREEQDVGEASRAGRDAPAQGPG